MRWFWIFLLIGWILGSMFSCSPAKRLSRLVKKHPELLAKDTITIRDTIVSEGSVKDTIFKFTGDTVVIKNERQEIKYFYNNTTQNHYIKGEVKPDTIYYENKIPVEKVVINEVSNFWPAFGWGAGGMFLFILLLLFLLSRIKTTAK